MPVSIFIDTGIDFLVSYTGTVHCTVIFPDLFIYKLYETLHLVPYQIVRAGGAHGTRVVGTGIAWEVG